MFEHFANVCSVSLFFGLLLMNMFRNFTIILEFVNIFEENRLFKKEIKFNRYGQRIRYPNSNILGLFALPTDVSLQLSWLSTADYVGFFRRLLRGPHDGGCGHAAAGLETALASRSRGELKDSVGERPYQSNFSDQKWCKILSGFGQNSSEITNY